MKICRHGENQRTREKERRSDDSAVPQYTPQPCFAAKEKRARCVRPPGLILVPYLVLSISLVARVFSSIPRNR